MSVLGANGGRLLVVLTGLAKSGETVCARLYGGRSGPLSLDRRRLGQFSTASEKDEGGEGREKLRECVRVRENRLERRSLIVKLDKLLPDMEWRTNGWLETAYFSTSISRLLTSDPAIMVVVVE